MQALFITICLAGAVYFLAFRRGFDFYTLAYLSSAVYFVPGIVGFDLVQDPIHPKSYGVFIVVLLGVWIAGALRQPRAVEPPRPPYGWAPQVAAALALVIVLYVVGRNGPQNLLKPKSAQNIIAGAAIAWRVSASLALVYGVLARRKLVMACGVLGLLAMFIASDRTAVAMTAFALGIELMGRRRGLTPLRAARGYILPMIVVVILGWGGKLMHIAIRESYRTGSISTVAQVVTGPTATRVLTTSTEPFLTQALLNQGVRRNLYIGPKHLQGVLFQLWPAPSMFGHPSHEFNDIVQAQLFPDAKKNTLAYNFWAEAIFSGGWLLLGVYVLIYVLGIEAANAAARSPNTARRGIGLLMGAYWAFYIQRNALASIVAYEKHVLFLGLAIVLVSALIATAGGASVRGRRSYRPYRRPRLPGPVTPRPAGAA